MLISGSTSGPSEEVQLLVKVFLLYKVDLRFFKKRTNFENVNIGQHIRAPEKEV